MSYISVIFSLQFTYYIPYFKDSNGTKHTASGKFVDKLYNLRKRAKNAGLRLQSNLGQQGENSPGNH